MQNLHAYRRTQILSSEIRNQRRIFLASPTQYDSTYSRDEKASRMRSFFLYSLEVFLKKNDKRRLTSREHSEKNIFEMFSRLQDPPFSVRKIQGHSFCL